MDRRGDGAGRIASIVDRDRRIDFAAAVAESLAREWLEEHTRWFGRGRDPVPGAENATALALVESDLGPVVAKRERPPGWKRPLVLLRTRAFRASRAFHLGRALRSAGVATPEPLAVIAHEGREAVLVTRYVEARDPWTFLLAGSGDPADVQALERALARTAGHLHSRGFRHRDLKAPNILVRRDAKGGIEVQLVDLDGASRVPSVTRAMRARDLSRLCTSFESAAARLAGVHADSWPRLVRHYLEEARGRAPAADDVDELVRRTRRWAEKHIERNLIRGRPIA